MPLRKTIIILFLLLGSPVYSFCQSITSLFLLLPPECTPELNIKEREILLEKQKYIIPGGDSIETEQYEINEKADNYLNYNYSFTTGQRAFISFQLRTFIKTDGNKILVYAKVAGLPANFNQTDVQIFDIKNKQLIRNYKISLPDSVVLYEFFRKDMPDSLKRDLYKLYSSSYDLSDTLSETIEYSIFPQSDYAQNWILGYSLGFIWNGENFIRGELIKQ